ncbi:MAG: glutamine-hydrolyzing GMP synthase [Treponema sp.]|nr:glutamine-hydrolyzing GMP synthase [Treponema sp.]
MDKIIILDFGSQTAQLIGRRIRDLGVYSEVVPGDSSLSELNLDGVRGIILSGSPESVYSKDGEAPDPAIYTSRLPLLGICYGLQRMTSDSGGLVEPLPKKEYGGVTVTGHFATDLPEQSRRFFAAFDTSLSLQDIKSGAMPSSSGGEWAITSWMSHGDSLSRLAPGFKLCGKSETGYPAVVAHESNLWFGLQFHPEVTHCQRGMEILAAFVFGVCGCSDGWTMAQYAVEAKVSLEKKVGKEPVLLLISGGVDSTVAGAFLLKSLNPDQVHLMYMDTGLMRKDATKNVKASLERLGAKHFHVIYCEEEFLAALKGLTDPEAKRKAIGDLFITIQEREVARLGLPETCFLAQGTIYPDIIESGKAGKKGSLIKSHHNVGSPLVAAKREAGRVIEPLEKLYKDEVRALGRFLNVEEDVISRHPFPGPGLAVRVLGEVTKEKCDILREADVIFIDELKKRKGHSGASLYDEIWQAFPVLLPIRSVGVAGDGRKYGWVLALRAIVSSDAMTADVYPFAMKDLLEISTLITNTVKDIGRVTYDISSKPPATIEWE